MPFPTKNDPQDSTKSVEKLVNASETKDNVSEMPDNVEKETPETKTEPVVMPVNANIPKELLGKPRHLDTLDKSLVNTVTPTKGGVVDGKPSVVQHGAGSTRNQLGQKNILSHVVRIENRTANTRAKYNFLVHCETCGWEGRYEFGEQAEDVRNSHIDANLRAA